MVGTITTSLTNQYKMDCLLGASPVFVVSNSQTGNTVASNNWIISLSNTANLSLGMTITSPAGINTTSTPVYISGIVNSSALVMSVPSTSATQNVMTFAGDTINMALIKFNPTNNYNRSETTCYQNLVGASDEASGAGYSNQGVSLTVSILPDVPDSNTAITNFSPNPSWTSATLDVAGAMIFSKAVRSGRSGPNATSFAFATGNTGWHAIGVYDFGGEQKVTSGTLTVNMPTANGTAAVIRVA